MIYEETYFFVKLGNNSFFQDTQTIIQQFSRYSQSFLSWPFEFKDSQIEWCVQCFPPKSSEVLKVCHFKTDQPDSSVFFWKLFDHKYRSFQYFKKITWEACLFERANWENVGCKKDELMVSIIFL